MPILTSERLPRRRSTPRTRCHPDCPRQPSRRCRMLSAMNARLPVPRAPVLEDPDSDGQPMADNTLQYEWIVTVEGNLEICYAGDPNVFVAGDLLWYAVEGHPEIRTAPDVLAAFGRPKGRRGSYKQWEEGGIAPQVVWEILS